jgi:hypothetical protein
MAIPHRAVYYKWGGDDKSVKTGKRDKNLTAKAGGRRGSRKERRITLPCLLSFFDLCAFAVIIPLINRGRGLKKTGKSVKYLEEDMVVIKKAFWGAVLFFAAVFTVAAAEPVVTVLNSTGNTFQRLFVNSSGSSGKDPNVLGHDVLENDNWIRVALPSLGAWDLIAVTKDGEVFAKFNYPIHNGTIIQFTNADLSRPPPMQGPTPVITVVNNTGYTLYFLHISRHSSSEWGGDVLENFMISPQGSIQIVLPAAGIWDFKAVDVDGDSYYKWHYSISNNTTIEFGWGDFSTQ